MCGIAGFISFDGHDKDAARQRVARMSSIQEHRGPDENGIFVDGHAALGHTRLAIIDLKDGQQPMATPDGQVVLVFNGEIYNFKGLRDELIAAGHVLKTHSDSEAILYAYLEWGEDCVQRLDGMFTFAIWDARQGLLFVARDRVGKKPFYFVTTENGFQFASEIKSLIAGDAAVGAVDPEALDCYLTMGYVPTPRTIFSNVRKLESAHWLVARRGHIKKSRYWSLDFSRPRKRTDAEAIEEFEHIFDGAVRSRLVSEVPLGAFLSGGIDSSLVVATMAKTMDRRPKTHTIGFSDASFSEMDVAREIAGFLDTDHQEFTVQPEAADVLRKTAWHFDEPFADSSALPTWYVCEMTRKSVTVALSGVGGDEGFGGYTFRYIPHTVESTVRRFVPPSIRSLVFGGLGAVWPQSARLPKPLRLKTIFNNLSVGDARAFYRDMTWLQEDVRGTLYRPEFIQNLKGFTPFETVSPYYRSDAGIDALSRCQSADINVYMTDDVLTKVDRMSMAHALEVRAPFLDHRVLEFAATLEPRQKMNLRQGKLLLRRLAGQRLPERIRKLPKQGFSIPAARWLRGDIKGLVEQTVFSGDGLATEVLDARVLRSLWNQHLSGERDHNVFFWGLLMLGLWETHYQ